MTLDCGSLKCCVPFSIVPLRLPPSYSYPDFPLCSGCDPSHSVRDQARVTRKTLERDLMSSRPIGSQGLERQAGLAPIPQLEPCCSHQAYPEA